MREPTHLTIRDGEKSLNFVITPMGAVQAESWLIRAAFALGSGFGGLTTDATVTDVCRALASADIERVAPLWDELLSCCQIKAGGATLPLDPATLDGKIQFPTTVFLLKVAALQANFGFFADGGLVNFLSEMRGVWNCGRSGE